MTEVQCHSSWRWGWVKGVEVFGDDYEVDYYYYYCDYYSQGETIGTQGQRAERKSCAPARREPSRGPRGRRGACGSSINEGSKMPRGNHGLRCGRWPRLGGIIKKNEKTRTDSHSKKSRKKGRNKLKMFRRKEVEKKNFKGVAYSQLITSLPVWNFFKNFPPNQFQQK